MSDLVKELEALDAKATKAPWAPRLTPRDKTWPGLFQVADLASFTFGWDGEEGIYCDNEHDPATAALLRNALPALIEYVKAQDRLVEMAIALSLELDKVQGIDTHPSLRIYAGVGANAMSTKSALLAALRGGK